jgi:hypothetical protein
MTENDESAVASALRSVITDYGWNVVRQPARLRAALNDQLGADAADHRSAIDALVVAAEEGVAAQVRSSGDQPRDAQVARLVEWGLTDSAARWAVDVWSAVAPASTLPPPRTTTPVGAPPADRPHTAPQPDATALPQAPLPQGPLPQGPLPQATPGPVWAGPAGSPGGPPPGPPLAPPPGYQPTALPPAGYPVAYPPQAAPPGFPGDQYPGQQPGPHFGWSPNQDPGFAPPIHPGLTPTELPGNATGAYPTGGPDATGGHRRRNLIVVAVVVVALALGVGGYFAFAGGDDSSGTQIALDGRRVSDPAVVLAATESTVRAIVEQRHGASAKPHCYFAAPKDAKTSGPVDVQNSIFCGPVLFVDGTPGEEYLEFALQARTAKNGVELTTSDTPSSVGPQKPPADSRLFRPDGITPPKGELKLPTPPPANGDELVAAVAFSPELPELDSTPVMGSISVGVRLTRLGEVERFGSGDEARTAPAGGKLIGFTVADGPCSQSKCSSWTSAGLTVAVSGATTRTLPSDNGDTFVVAVPSGAASVDLHMTRDGYSQSISLLDGRPGSRNLRYFERVDHAYRDLKKVVKATERFSIPLTWKGNSQPSRNYPITMYVNWTALYFELYDTRPSSPANAFLYFDIDYTSSEFPRRANKTVNCSYLSFNSSTGARYKARDLDKRDKYSYCAFEVPATLTGGSLVIGGTTTRTSTLGNRYRDTIPTRRVSVTF